MPAVTRLTERDLESIAMERFGCYSARVREIKIRNFETRDLEPWLSLSTKDSPSAESRIIGLRRTKSELLRLIERGPLGKF
jgi:hypothetical protein